MKILFCVEFENKLISENILNIPSDEESNIFFSETINRWPCSLNIRTKFPS